MPSHPEDAELHQGRSCQRYTAPNDKVMYSLIRTMKTIYENVSSFIGEERTVSSNQFDMAFISSRAIGSKYPWVCGTIRLDHMND